MGYPLGEGLFCGPPSVLVVSQLGGSSFPGGARFAVSPDVAVLPVVFKCLGHKGGACQALASTDVELLVGRSTVADSTLAEILGDHCEANRKALLTMLHIARRGFPGYVDLGSWRVRLLQRSIQRMQTRWDDSIGLYGGPWFDPGSLGSESTSSNQMPPVGGI